MAKTALALRYKCTPSPFERETSLLLLLLLTVGRTNLGGADGLDAIAEVVNTTPARGWPDAVKLMPYTGITLLHPRRPDGPILMVSQHDQTRGRCFADGFSGLTSTIRCCRCVAAVGLAACAAWLPPAAHG